MGYNVLTSKGEKIVLADTPLSKGGEGEVRQIISPAHYTNNCVKIYYIQNRTKDRADKIQFMIDNPPAQIQSKSFMIGWPIDTIHHLNKEFVGFMMPLAFQGSKELAYLTSTTLNYKKLGNNWYKYEHRNGKSAKVARLKLMNNIAIPIHLIHQTGKYVLQDFKPANVLVTHTGQITICDIDSIQITNGYQTLFRGQVSTPDYRPPEYNNNNVGKNASDILKESWDNFALGVVFYQLLFGLHPYSGLTPKQQKDPNENSIASHIDEGLFPFGNNAYKIKSYSKLHENFVIVPPKLQTLFKRAFSQDPKQRPRAEEWGKVIHEIILNAGPIPDTPMPPNPATQVKPTNSAKQKSTPPKTASAKSQVTPKTQSKKRNKFVTFFFNAYDFFKRRFGFKLFGFG